MRIIITKKRILWIVAGAVITVLFGAGMMRIGQNQLSGGGYAKSYGIQAEGRPSAVASFGLARLGNAGAAASFAVADQGGGAQQEERLVIKTGNFSLVVADIQNAVARLVLFVENNGGFVVSKYIAEQDKRPSGHVTVRVPVGKLDALVAEARQASMRVVSEEVTGQDVTEEYVDIKARLVNLVAAENRFRDLLSRAQKIDEILSVQREMDRVRSEIDQVTARKQYLERSAALSNVTFYLAMDEEELPVVTPGEQWRPKVAYLNAVRGVLNIGRSLGSLVIWIAVLSAVWVPALMIALAARYFWKRRRSKPLQS